MLNPRHIAAYLIAGAAGITGLQYVFTSAVSNVVNSPSAKAEGEVAKMERDALKKYPGKPRTEGLAYIAAERATQELNSAADPKERAFKAAQIFFGFYLVNTRARPAFCQKEGVDISEFVRLFAQDYKTEYTLAVDIVRRRGITEDKIYRPISGALERMIETEMFGLRNYRYSNKQVCETFAQRAPFYVNQIDLRRRQPDVIRALYPA
jgi:hypothetical protein